MNTRKCVAADKEIWVKLNKRHMEETLGSGDIYWKETHDKGIKKLEESFEIALEKDHSIILLLFEQGDEVIGFANLNAVYSVWSKGEALIVDDFFIAPEYRGGGLGQEGLVLVEKYAMDNNYTRIQFHSDIEDESFVKVWTDYGYKPADKKFYMRYI